MHAPRTHAPAAQDEAAFANPHVTPHPPQLDALVCVLVSQPFAVDPSQFAKPKLQLAMPQTPAVQDGAAFVTAHALPHAPQLPTSAVVAVSQPFDAIPSQLPHPASQAPKTHALAEHEPAWCGREHLLPHVPQLVADDVRSVSQPLPSCPSQFPHPV